MASRAVVLLHLILRPTSRLRDFPGEFLAISSGCNYLLDRLPLQKKPPIIIHLQVKVAHDRDLYLRSVRYY